MQIVSGRARLKLKLVVKFPDRLNGVLMVDCVDRANYYETILPEDSWAI